MRRYLRSFIPERTHIGPRERVRTAVGGLVGILLTGLLSRVWLGEAATLPVLIAPMGASAVLLFAVPASPLAQPWSIIGGNLVAASVGVTAAAHLSDPILASAIAEGVTIALMMAFRCVHPPSGAVALTAVLGGQAITRLGYAFVLWPVIGNSLVLLAGALAFNNLTGRRYPHVAGDLLANPGTARAARAGASDLDAVLDDLDQVLEIGRGDLEVILRRSQLRAALRPSRGLPCSEIMTRDVVAVAPDASLDEAVGLLRHHRIKMLPVTDESARVVGVITPSDLLDKAALNRSSPRLRVSQRLLLTLKRGRAPQGCVEDVMTVAIECARPSMSASEVMLAMTGAGVHHLPVIGDDDRLLGVVTQTDLVTALLAPSDA